LFADEGRRQAGRAFVAVVILAAAAGVVSAQADPNKVLRVTFPVAETGFDPQASNDLYSNHINRAMFESPYRYDHLARPYKIIPNTAAALPEISADGINWIIRIKPGIYFTDDPAFKGQKRELTAADYVYSWKRVLDPKTRSPNLQQFDGKFVGADVMVAKAKQTGKFDYDAPLEGLSAPDRYTIKIKLTGPSYDLLSDLTDVPSMAVAREVIETYGDGAGWAMANPVGTGPYRLKDWRRGQKIVLDANPGYREVLYPESQDPADRAIMARLKGRKIPLIGRVEINIIEESNPRLLAFEKGQFDYVTVPADLVPNVVDASNKLKPPFAKAGVTLARGIQPSISYTFFNMDDAIVGGYTKDRVALRRAIGMAYNSDEEIRILWNGQAVPATQPIPPGVTGHDPKLNGHVQYNLSGAKGLLDKFGYVDRDGDGWRDLPDGKPPRAGDGIGSRCAQPAVRGNVEAQPDGGRYQGRFHQAEVAGSSQDGARGAAADVVSRQHQRDHRRLQLPRPALRRARRTLQLRAFQPARIQQALRRFAQSAG
jgi:ABC-type transport system substrate-binding protein